MDASLILIVSRVGFNSVYHLTDLPSFVSGKHVVLFDPQGVYLPNVSTANPGKRIEYVSSSAISLYEDQFFPYCAFGCDMRSPFLGTLFRFPLRNADQAASSKLSKQAYLEDDVSSMFDQLYDEGILSLLFLKCILSIEMYVWDVGIPEPRKIYSCSINSASDDVVWHRQALHRLLKSKCSSDSEMDAFSLDFLNEALVGGVPQIRTHKFYVVQMMASQSSRIGAFAATAAKDYDMHLLPWAAVAACISDDSVDVICLERHLIMVVEPAFVASISLVAEHSVSPIACKKLVSAFKSMVTLRFLQIVAEFGTVMTWTDLEKFVLCGTGFSWKMLWHLVFAKLLLGMRQLLGSTEIYYSLWPVGLFEEPWSLLVEHIYRSIWGSPVLYSNVEGGKWISPEEAFLHDMEISGSKEFGDVLVQLGMPIVPLPSDLFNMILNCKTVNHQKVVTPDSVRHYLRGKYLSVLGRSDMFMLLEYCLEDLIDTDVGVHSSQLPLLPLANGELGSLSRYSEGITYFICNELEFILLQQISYRLIDRSIPVKLLNRLTSIANVSGANLVVFSVNEFIQLFSEFVPAEWKYKTNVLWNPNSNPTHPTSSWFLLLWRYLREQCQELSLFGDWPIIPLATGHLYRPSRQKKC
ncbi:hypothetical protein BUALT_Bualt09G0019100 [Buddleja alternifolia]|uniref:Sacsin/Nov domain-containing protein n=1 Tax=Buddleja alternifolia TaxID=168488 RepID=A0AAV6WYF5_9LAMI|nr:hypothetical protein BUALT_Bualt09G0019100 [Buddleja alternifolia]